MARLWFRSFVAVVAVGSLTGCVANAKKIESSRGGVKASGAVVAEAASADAVPSHVTVAPSAIKWLNFPLGGPGVKAAVIAGDPEKPGPFVLRIKSPAGAKVPPFDPAAEAPMEQAAKTAIVTTIGHARGEGIAVLSAEE